MAGVSLEVEGRTATLRLDRPPLNILDLTTLEELRDAVERVASQEELQVLIVTGRGDRAFSAGVAVEDHTPDKITKMLELFHGALVAILELEAVTIAAVDGHCLGGGLELAAACDLVVATERSRFGQPEIKLGCYPPFAAALYPERIGPGPTLDLLVTGRTVEAEEARRLGLVHRLAAAGELESAVAELTDAILAHSGPVVRITKRAVRAGTGLRFPEALRESERLYLEELAQTADMREGIEAFLAKREPRWRHE